ncbi:glycosyltransferase [Enterococcus rivorum]|uniref:glycosyltransferase n=1 Tax=Enterococcus rivorum TaxID=762845 RepID=UPI00363CDB1B
MNIMIILNYNDAFNTISYLSKIETFSSVDKYIVVDNHSTDNSYQKFLELPNTDKVIFLEAKVNRGYAHGNNIGIKYAVNNFSVKNIIISNPDIEVKENTIKVF